MKHNIISTSVAVVALVAATALGAEPQNSDPVKLTPRPKMVAWEQGKFQLRKSTKIMYSGESAKQAADALGEKLRPATGYPFPVAGPPLANTAFFGILLELQPKADHLGNDGFMMEVGPGMARIAAATTNGLDKGCSIFIQLLPAAILETNLQENVKWEVPCCKLFDLPDDSAGPTK
jgi:hexosaminidase